MVAIKIEVNQKCEVEVRNLGSNGEGIGRVEGFTVFVEGALPGEVVNVRISQVKKNYATGESARKN